MKGFTVSEQGHIVNILSPQSIAGAVTSDVFSLKDYEHATIIVTAGSTNADAGNITVEQCDDFTPSNHAPITFDYYAEETAAGDTLAAKVVATVAGIDVSGNDNIIYAIEIDASHLTNDYPCLQLRWSAPGGATLVSAVAVLTGARYGSSQTPTAIV